MSHIADRRPLLRHRARYLTYVVVALLGIVGSSSAAIAWAGTSPTRAVVLSGGSVGPIRFDEPQQKAVGALNKLIGPAEGGVQDAQGNCTIDAGLYWANFSAYFFRGRFVGYQNANNLTDKQEPAFNGKTPQGLRIGDTLAAARKLYPGRVTTRGVNGGVYALKTATGTIRGYLSLEVSAPPNNIKIVSISAGSVGCPAASPG